MHKSNLRGASESAPDSLICAQVRRWGALAGAGKEDRDWKLFVESRLSTPPPVSPIDFLQEYYAADSWRLLVSCILMSRVSSWKTKCASVHESNLDTPTVDCAQARVH